MKQTLPQIILAACLTVLAVATAHAQLKTDAVADADTCNDLGVSQINVGNYSAAVELLNKAIQLRPQDPVKTFQSRHRLLPKPPV